MSTYPVSPELAARPSSSCSDAETTPRSLTGDTTPRLTRGVVRRLREQLEQAEAELEANKAVIRDSQLAKHREQLLSFSSVEPGLVLMSVPEGHSASAKEIQCIKADQMKIIAEYEQIIQALSMTAKSQQTQKRCAHKDLLKLRENLASSSGRSSSAQSSADLEVSSLVQELSGVYRRLDEAKQQLAMAADLASFQEELEDVTAFLQEANSYNATLASDLEYAHRQHSELHSKLSLQIEYLQRDVEVAQREGDAARRSLRDSKEAHVQALHAQSAAFDQTLDDAKTVAAQDILKFAAALDESQRKESEAVQRLQWSQLELHQQTAALRGEVVESRNKHMQCAQQLQDAEEELEQVIAKLEQQVSSLTAALEDSKQREGLTAHKLSRCEQQLQTEVAALQLDGALASPHQGSGSQLGQLRKEGTGSQLRQLQKEVLSLADKLAEQQSKTAQAEAAGTLMQLSVDLTKQVSDANPRPASPLVAFSTYSPLALAHSTSPSEAASLTTDILTHVTLSEPLGARALGMLSPLTPVSPAVGLSATALTALSGMSHCSPLVRPSAPALRALPSITPASSALHACAPASRALFSLSLADGSVLQSAPALKAPSSLSSVGAVPDSPDTRRTLSSGGEHTRLQTPIALAHMPSPLQTAGPTASLASQPRIPVRQTKKQQAMMDSVDGKLVKAMPGTSASVSLKNAAVHSPEGMSVHSASLQRESRMSLSKAGGRSPFGDMTNNIGYRLVTPDRIPKLPQDVSKTTARSRFSIGDRCSKEECRRNWGNHGDG
ncbi:hypothetical protein WJX79_002775 [Trebouxia sp. C0005]